MPPLIFLIRVKSGKTSLFIPLPVFLLPLLWIIFLPFAIIMLAAGMVAALFGKKYLLGACAVFFWSGPRLYYCLKGLYVKVISKDQFILVKVI